MIVSSTATLPTASVVLLSALAGVTETVTGVENVPDGQVTVVPSSLVTVPGLAGEAAAVGGVASAGAEVVEVAGAGIGLGPGSTTGVAAGVTAFDAADAPLVPSWFVAVTANVYSTPFVRPIRSSQVSLFDVAPPVTVAPPGEAVTV